MCPVPDKSKTKGRRIRKIINAARNIQIVAPIDRVTGVVVTLGLCVCVALGQLAYWVAKTFVGPFCGGLIGCGIGAIAFVVFLVHTPRMTGWAKDALKKRRNR